MCVRAQSSSVICAFRALGKVLNVNHDEWVSSKCDKVYLVESAYRVQVCSKRLRVQGALLVHMYEECTCMDTNERVHVPDTHSQKSEQHVLDGKVTFRALSECKNSSSSVRVSEEIAFLTALLLPARTLLLPPPDICSILSRRTIASSLSLTLNALVVRQCTCTQSSALRLSSSFSPNSVRSRLERGRKRQRVKTTWAIHCISWQTANVPIFFLVHKRALSSCRKHAPNFFVHSDRFSFVFNLLSMSYIFSYPYRWSLPNVINSLLITNMAHIMNIHSWLTASSLTKLYVLKQTYLNYHY